jgi:hypothetical protein
MLNQWASAARQQWGWLIQICKPRLALLAQSLLKTASLQIRRVQSWWENWQSGR